MTQIPKRVEITPYPGGKRMAVTTSFDDGVISDRRLVAAFNEWGLKGTFNLNSGTLGTSGVRLQGDVHQRIDRSEVAELYRGHEVAIHTVTHPDFRKLDPSQVALEVLEDRKVLEDLVGYPVRGMAYPYGHSTPRVVEILRSLGIVYCRTCNVASPCFPPAEPLLWPTTGHQYAENPSIPQQFEALYSRPNYTGTFFVWGHSYEFGERDDWAALERIFKPLSGKPDIWYCTNIELFDYEAARQRLVISANRAHAFNPSALPVTLSLDGELVDVPGGKTISLVKT
jgi:peptidoglycan/xylan/chitin deacetylase (PgdA/CDA1 family)